MTSPRAGVGPGNPSKRGAIAPFCLIAFLNAVHFDEEIIMKSRSFLSAGAFCLTLIALTGGCGGAVDGEQENSENLGGDLGLGPGGEGAPITVDLNQIGNPKWKPVDFHQFTSKWFKYQQIMTNLLPPPDHVWSPLLGVAPGEPHDRPYDTEIADGMKASGLVDDSIFTSAEFVHGVYLTWMNIPRKDNAPLGSSPDFKNGPIIPNALFPINVKIQYMRDGVIDNTASVFDVPALDPSMSAAPVDGHSHFPMWTNDSSGSYAAGPAPGNYAWLITMIDANSNGWTIEVPFRVD
jgi:hypothetical protein